MILRYFVCVNQKIMKAFSAYYVFKNQIHVSVQEFISFVIENIFWSLLLLVGTQVYVHLTEKWMGKVRGLCGNYDQDSTNDFISRSNSVEHVPSAFAHTWRIYDCQMIPQDKPYSNKHPCIVSILVL